MFKGAREASSIWSAPLSWRIEYIMHPYNILLGTLTLKILGPLNANCSNWLKVRTSNLTGMPQWQSGPFHSPPPLTSSPAPSLVPLPHSRTLSFSPALLPYHFCSPLALPLSSVPSLFAGPTLIPYPFAPHLPQPFSSPCSFHLPFSSPLLITSSLPITSSHNPSLLPQPFSLPITFPKLTHNLHIYTYANCLIILAMPQSEQETLKI